MRAAREPLKRLDQVDAGGGLGDDAALPAALGVAVKERADQRAGTQGLLGSG